MQKNRWFLTAWIVVVLAATAGFATFHFVKAKIARSFSVPDFRRQVSPKTGTKSDYDFQYSTLDGKVRRISQLRGKVVFVNFWGTWCIRCVVEMPNIQKLYDKLKHDKSVVFLIPSRLDTPERVRWYARYNHYDLPFYTVRDQDIPPAMHFNQYPTTFIYDKDGLVVEKQIGGANWDDPKAIQYIKTLESQ
jgi:thiol-disulfide isomerase/thioredoxin